MNAYTVAAHRWERGWELHIADTDGHEIGVTQSSSLTGAERMVRDYLAADGVTDATITVRPVLDGVAAERVRRTKAMVAQAERVQREAAAASRELVRDLKVTGLSGPEIAKVLDLSPQRVSQLGAGPK